MKLRFGFLLTVLLATPLSVYAEVMHYSLCTLSDGKTLGDVQQWIDDWRPIAKRAGIEYEVRLLVGHAAPAEEMPPNFYLEGSSPTLSTHAKAWEWWYGDEEAGRSATQLFSTATCRTNSIFTSTE